MIPDAPIPPDDLTADKVIEQIRRTRTDVPVPVLYDDDLADSAELTPEKVLEALRATRAAAEENQRASEATGAKLESGIFKPMTARLNGRKK